MSVVIANSFQTLTQIVQDIKGKKEGKKNIEKNLRLSIVMTVFHKTQIVIKIIQPRIQIKRNKRKRMVKRNESNLQVMLNLQNLIIIHQLQRKAKTMEAILQTRLLLKIIIMKLTNRQRKVLHQIQRKRINIQIKYKHLTLIVKKR